MRVKEEWKREFIKKKRERLKEEVREKQGQYWEEIKVKEEIYGFKTDKWMINDACGSR